MTTIKRPCPLCGACDAEALHTAIQAVFDQSPLSGTVEVCLCRRCGMVYNDLGTPEILADYYERMGFSGHEPNPGQSRFESIHGIIAPRMRVVGDWVDIGCGPGRLLKYVKEHDSRFDGHLCGVDLNRPALAKLEREGIKPLQCPADQLPLPDASVAIWSSCHNLEHLYNVNATLAEARRVLAPDGLIFISVPDAEFYGEGDIFSDGRWTYLEHINHFDSEHLAGLVRAHGFELEAQGHLPIESYLAGRRACPHYGTYVLGRKSDGPLLSAKITPMTRLEQAIREQIKSDQIAFEGYRRLLTQWGAFERPLYLWGINIFFLILGEELGLKNAPVKALIDANPFFHRFTLGGRPIEAPSAFGRAEEGDLALIFGFNQAQAMLEQLKRSGFPGQALVLQSGQTL
jgi:Methylase involved in ubiquinone/menaquinone biosynthesis